MTFLPTNLLLELNNLKDVIVDTEKKLDNMVASKWIKYFHDSDAYDELTLMISSLKSFQCNADKLDIKIRLKFNTVPEDDGVHEDADEDNVNICHNPNEPAIHNLNDIEPQYQEVDQLISNTSLTETLEKSFNSNEVDSEGSPQRSVSEPKDNSIRLVLERISSKGSNPNECSSCGKKFRLTIQKKMHQCIVKRFESRSYRTKTKLATKIKAQKRLLSFLATDNTSQQLYINCLICKDDIIAKEVENHVRIIHNYSSIFSLKADFPEFSIPIECSTCEKWFKNGKILVWHKRRKCGTLKSYKQILKEITAKKKSGYYLDHDQDEPIECCVCYEMFLPIDVKQHYKSHNKAGSAMDLVQCVKCEKVLPNSKKLAWHLRQKCGQIKPYKELRKQMV